MYFKTILLIKKSFLKSTGTYVYIYIYLYTHAYIHMHIYVYTYACMTAKSLPLCPTLEALWTVAHQAPLSMGFSR